MPDKAPSRTDVRSRAVGDVDRIDDQLVGCVARGDQAAFERLHGRFFKPVFGFALRITGSFEAAEEVANDTLLAIWRQAARYERRSRVSTWVFGIAYHLALKARVKTLRHDRHDLWSDDMPEAAATGDHVEQLLIRRQLSHALSRLPARQRAVVELTYSHGYSYEEIAKIVDCPVGTVKTRMMNARIGLRGLLAEPQQPVLNLKTKAIRND